VLTLLREVERGQRLDVRWEARATSLAPRDRAWAHALLYGVVRFRGRLDYRLEQRLHQGLAAVHPDLRNVLRMGAWQVLYMEGVPTYAAVAESVAQARALPRPAGGRGAAGLVNAVLRRLSEEGGDASRFPSWEDDPAGYLSTWGSHPVWLVDRWMARHGAERAREQVEAGNRIPQTTLRHLPSGSLHPLEPGADIRAALAAHHPAQVQDPAASAVVDVALEACRSAPHPGPVVDLCAAPGGKGFGVAGGATARMAGCLIGADPSRVRLRRMRENAARLEIPVHLVAARAEHPPFPKDWASVVLVDAPCTGTGTLARHPDARWRLTPDAPQALAQVQRRILAGARGIVAPGGSLVYSTCTLEPEENEEQVAAFLEAAPDFAFRRMETIGPGAQHGDGAFVAWLARRS
jgi:16S rRNA (cytosine967-C5)-methyltransferase